MFGILSTMASPVLGFSPRIAPLKNTLPGAGYALLVWTNLLLFNIHNQRHPEAILEDSINKPWRPLPAERLTPTQATDLMSAMYPVVIIASADLGGLGPCLVEALLSIRYKEWRGAKNPVLKNLLNGVGIACFLVGPLEISVDATSVASSPKVLQWLVLTVLAMFMTIHIQDFPDQDGDRLRSRRTVGDG
jgi:4-hydroxybenzoate polyprenyltransferase